MRDRLHIRTLLAQGALTFVLLAVSTVQAAADGMEDFDFDLPDWLSFQQYLSLLVNLDEAVETVAFYSFLSAVLLILFGLTIALKQYVWSAYTGVAAFGLIYIALHEQNQSGIYWTGLQLLPRDLLILGHVMISVNFVTSAFAIPTHSVLRRFRWPLVGCAVLGWGVWGFGLSQPVVTATVLFNVSATLGGLSHAIPFSTFRHLDGGYDRGLRIGVSVLALALVVTVALVSVEFGDEEIDRVFASRLLIVAVIGFLVFFFIRRVYAVRQSREAAIQKTIEDAKREAEISRDLLDVQKQHSETLEVARLQKMRLATASHDIRQPIMSLRTTMDALSQRQTPEVKAQLRAAFDYLDQLAASYIVEARGDAPMVPDADDLSPMGAEVMSTQLLGETLTRMFSDEAAKSGTPLQVDVEPAEISVQPLSLMRVLSNLVSNAITHAKGGVIALRAVRENGEVAIEVDNEGELPEGDVFAAFAKGAESGGQGLGLAIIREQAERDGYRLSHSSGGGRTVFRLGVDLA